LDREQSLRERGQESLNIQKAQDLQKKGRKKRMKLKKMAALFAVATTVAVVAGCSSSSKETTAETTEAQTSAEETTAEETTEAETAETEEEEEENYNTGDASKDNPRNQDEIGEDELMVVSFGTSYNDNRRMTVGAIEDAIEKASPDYSVRRAFTSQIIIDHVKSRDNEIIDNVTEALDRAEKNGVKRLVIQPTHLMNGLEYTDLVNEVAERSDAFEKVSIGEPLLTSDEDFKAVMTAITEATAEYDDGETAICFMGHGTEADSNQIYAKMQDLLTESGYENYFVGTVEATPSLEDVLAKVQAGEYKKVVLEPLMIVAGDHANNDMAGDEDGSWKKTFEDAGYEVTCLVRGLGELEPIQQLFVQHAQAAVDNLAK
jgi:sirohydrochlorin cobaltochelatase